MYSRVIRNLVPEPVVACNVVLVKQGQSGQDYRACANMIPLNQRTVDTVYPLPDCMAGLEPLGGVSVKTTVDIKAGFHNVPFHPDMLKYTGLVT